MTTQAIRMIIESDVENDMDDISVETENTVDGEVVEEEMEEEAEEEEMEEEMEEEAEEEATAKTQWKLDRTKLKSIFSCKKMKERTNMKMVLGFIEAEMGITYQGNTRYSGMPKELKTELDLMKQYAEHYQDKDDTFDVGHILPKHKWGRTIPAGYASLSVMHRPTRHALCAGFYRDKDMANCHPQLIAEIAEQHGVMMPKLRAYNANYKAYRQRICEHHGLDYRNPDHKNIAKQLPIRLVYGGKYENWIRENNIPITTKMEKFVKIEVELGAIRELVWTNNQAIYRDVIKQDPKKWKNQEEAKRGVQGLWCQTIERLLMEDCVAFLVEEKDFKLENVVPCQDGLMVEAQLNYPEMEADFEARILELYGVVVKWEDKEFDEAIEIPLYTKRIITTTEWFDIVTPKPMAERLLKLKEEQILFNYTTNELFIYYGNRWFNESKLDRAHKLRRIISEDLYDDVMADLNASCNLKPDVKESLGKMIRNITCKAGSYTDIIKQLISIAKPAGENQFDCNPHLLGFENGKMDLRTRTFTPYQPTDYITLTTLYDYRSPDYETNPEDNAMKETWAKLFEEIQPAEDRRLLLLQILASGLDGNAYQSLWCLNGRGGNGKGLLGRQMEEILGDNFAITPSNALLAEDKNASANAPSPAVAELRFKRWLSFKEMGGTLHLPALRRLTGGDAMRGRLLNENPVKVLVVATIIAEFNKSPDYDQAPQDADYRRVKNIDFPNNWTTDPVKIGKTIDGISYKEGNAYYETTEFRRKARDVFLDLLLGVYTQSFDETHQKINFNIPDSVWNDSRKMVDGNNKFSQWFEKAFEPSPSRLVDHKIKKEEYDQNGKTKKTTHMPAQFKVGDLWDIISNTQEYKSGQRTKAREFERNWGKKEFFRWAKASLDVKSTSKYDYVLGYKQYDTPEIKWKTNQQGEVVDWEEEEEMDDDDLA